MSLKSSRRHHLFQHIVNMRKSTVSRGLPPFFKISGRMPSCPGDFLFLRPLIASFTSSMVKGLSSSWRTGSCCRLDNAEQLTWDGWEVLWWRYCDLPNVPVAQRCQPGVLRQLQVKGTLSSELGRWLPAFHCKVREGHHSLRIVVCMSSSFPSRVRLQNEWDVERYALQPITPCERNGCFSLLPSNWLIVWLQRQVEEGRRCRETSQAAPLIGDHRPRVHWT